MSVCVSNLSSSGRLWEMDQVPAVGDPTHVVLLGAGDRVAAGERQRRVALQRRVARQVRKLGRGRIFLQICVSNAFEEASASPDPRANDTQARTP
jgi:hypothetical protein